MEEKNLKQKADETYEFMEQIRNGNLKVKKLKIPRKAKVKKGKIKKGWIGVLKIHENGNISGEKVKLHESAFQLKEGTFHASDGKEIALWEGKHPVIIQQTWKKNPMNLRLKEGERNETYGDPYVKAKLLKSVLVMKKKGGHALIWIIGLAVLGFIGYSMFT